MAENRVQRRLAAIMAADVVGYSRHMGEDEAGTRANFNDCLNLTVKPTLEEHAGRLVKTMGDGFLVEFGSVLAAVQAAIDIQSGWSRHQQDVPPDKRLELRIGVHSGDVIVEGDDIHGDGVNIAARLEGIAEPNGICISSMVREGIRNKVDVALSDLGEKSLKNIAEPIHVYHVEWEQQAGDVKDLSGSDAMFRRPAVAVLPFENLSGDPEQEYFADGLTEDIITALSHWRSFPVIARNSTFAYKGKSPDIRKVGEELGARYVVEGSVRKAGGRVRITAQLINAETGHHVWAERYDRNLDDIFEVQDEITLRIAAIIEPAIQSSEYKRVSSKSPSNLNAWDLCIQGFSLIYQGSEESNRRARKLFERAIELDPDYSRAWTGLAYTYGRDFRMGYSNDPKTAAQKHLEATRKAVSLDESDSEARLMYARSLNMTGQTENALTEIKRAVDLNPQNSMANWTLGVFLYLRDRAEEAIPWIEKSLEINPLDPRDYVVRTHLATAKLLAGEYAEAAELARASLNQRPDYVDARATLAAALGYLGQQADAKEVARDNIDKIRDHVENSSHPLRRNISHYFSSGLQKAGLL